MFDADDGGQAFARVFTAEVGIRIFQNTRFASVIVDTAGDRGSQTSQVSPAVTGIDRVGESID